MPIVKIAAFWELAWNTPIKEIDLWQYPIRDFGIETFYMVPISGIESRRVIERSSLEEIIEENSELDIVYVTEGGKTNLVEFVHPENVLYIFGKTNYSPFNTMGTGKSVRIDTVKNKGMLWGHQAASIVLYDRMLKWP